MRNLGLFMVSEDVYAMIMMSSLCFWAGNFDDEGEGLMCTCWAPPPDGFVKLNIAQARKYYEMKKIVGCMALLRLSWEGILFWWRPWFCRMVWRWPQVEDKKELCVKMIV